MIRSSKISGAYLSTSPSLENSSDSKFSSLSLDHRNEDKNLRRSCSYRDAKKFTILESGWTPTVWEELNFPPTSNIEAYLLGSGVSIPPESTDPDYWNIWQIIDDEWPIVKDKMVSGEIRTEEALYNLLGDRLFRVGEGIPAEVPISRFKFHLYLRSMKPACNRHGYYLT